MNNKPAHSLEEVMEAVGKGFTRTGTATVLHCSRATIDNYAKRWKSVDDALRGKRVEMVDLAEMGLRGAVLRGEAWAITFCLKTLGREDYAERREITGKDGQAVELKITEMLVRLPDEGDESTGDE